ncbi:ribokinase [Erysipelothrix sp. HDW6C]|uniref:ribokinase n=1 Tax=Erysipelothrix sp. HDW6C TaxID=2714930 RepID=UPI001407232E|nr:ribokinase [Erysipelothrix sp. HDW6C]QIK70418.1 ribokinase [Erysipelothrix sp. HDW6C]
MKERNVVVLGSINADIMISSNRIPEQGETIAGFDYFQSIGGKGGNQAVAVSKLGTQTALIGCVGRDYQGQLALNALQEANINTQYVGVSDTEHTGTAVVLRVDNDNRIIINQGANGAITQKQLEDALKESEASVFLTQFEVPMNTVYEGLQMAKDLGMKTVVNPAPAFDIDESQYQYMDYLVLNQSESKALSGIFPSNHAEAKEAAAYFIKRGVKHIILTLGGDGSYYIDAENEVSVSPYKVDVVDTTGAGDAYIGTLIYGLAHEFSVQKMLEYASAAGALACTRKGAQSSLPVLTELETFIQENKEN